MLLCMKAALIRLLTDPHPHMGLAPSLSALGNSLNHGSGLEPALLQCLSAINGRHPNAN